VPQSIHPNPAAEPSIDIATTVEVAPISVEVEQQYAQVSPGGAEEYAAFVMKLLRVSMERPLRDALQEFIGPRQGRTAGNAESMLPAGSLALLTLLLSGCASKGTDGGGIAGFLGSSGVVLDGYIEGATVFRDSNANKLLDPGEASVRTTANGAFSGLGGDPARPIAVLGDGRDVSTSLDFKRVLTAPGGSTVITPLTTLVQALIKAGQDNPALAVADPDKAVLDAFNLPATINLRTFDPVASYNASTGQAKADALAVQTVAARIANLLVTGAVMNAAVPGANTDVTFQAESIITRLLIDIRAGGAIDLTSRVVVQSYLDTNVSGSLVQLLADFNNFDSTTLARVVQAQSLVQGKAAGEVLDVDGPAVLSEASTV